MVSRYLKFFTDLLKIVEEAVDPGPTSLWIIYLLTCQPLGFGLMAPITNITSVVTIFCDSRRLFPPVLHYRVTSSTSVFGSLHVEPRCFHVVTFWFLLPAPCLCFLFYLYISWYFPKGKNFNIKRIYKA